MQTEFQFKTAYHQEALMTMAKVLRKTARKKRSRRSRLLAPLVIALGILLTLPLGGREFVLDLKTVVTWLVVAILFFTLLFEDHINGYFARKRMLPGLNQATATFRAEGYHSETELGSSEFKYSSILLLAETADYFVFVFSQNHAQVYDKNSISGGTVEEFREFIKAVTGKEIQTI